jgi:murein DD-endopeptidase MepM/ murein hydrolase activator NlpD
LGPVSTLLQCLPHCPASTSPTRADRGSVFLVSLMFLVGIPGLFLGPAAAARAGSLRVGPTSNLLAASLQVAAPSYYRPVVVDGKAFPVARSNFLSLLEFPNNWHAPRLRLINGTWRLVGVHLGIDIISERGTPILAMERGVVENVGWTFYSGTRVGVRGVDGRYYLYAHLSSVQPGVRTGARVGAGAVLGRVGNTGYGPSGHRDEFPPHLHFGIESAGGEWVNPYPTLVQLYAAAVTQTTRAQTALDRLAAMGKRDAWTLRAQRTYMSLSPSGGE